jgi:hypothetical protein
MYIAFRSYLSGITLEKDNNSINVCGINKDYVRNNNFLPNKDGCQEISSDEIIPFFGDIIIRSDRVNSGSTRTYALEYAI